MNNKTTEIILGIDLGTTNSLVAARIVNPTVNSSGSEVQVFSDGESNLIPSVIVFSPEGQVQAVGQRAKTLKALDPERVIYSVKRLMGKGKADISQLPFELPFDFSESTEQMIKIKVGKKTYSPIELSAEILKRCKSVAENKLGHSIRKAVITVPAYFNESQRSATALAGRLADLEVVRILNEPTAAALAFGLGTKKSGIVAVYDFGGGTFDISILKITDGIFEVLSTDGDTLLGGDDIDHALYQWILKEKVCLQPTSEEDKILVLSQIEAIKKALTAEEEISATIHWGGEVRWQGRISNREVEAVISPLVERTIDCCRAAIKAADCVLSSISEVVMVGGSSRIPLVRSKVKSFFKRDLNISVNPEEVVAVGAAIQGSILAGETKDTLLLDVVPLSLGLETMGGLVTKLIARNSTIPTSASEHFTTYADNQTAIDIHILQGEREMVSDCRSLGKFKLQIAPAPAGVPKVEVSFLMDANGMLKVRARDERSGHEESLELKPSFGLNDEEVEKMLQDAWDNAQRDFAERQLIEATNQAQSLIHATERSLKSPVVEKDFLAVQETRIFPVLNALKRDLERSNAAVIALRTKELDQITQELAQHILDQSIQARLLSKTLTSAY